MGQNNGDSGLPLTVDSAAQAIEALLPDESGDEQTEVATPEAKDEVTPELEASDDDEVDTALAPDEESEDDGDKPEAKEEAPPKHKVKINDQELEVTLDEALKGYSRTEDYTRKTQKLAQERNEFLAEAQATRAERQNNAAKLAELDHALTSLVQEPNWEQLQRENPDQFAAVHAAWLVHEKRLNTIRTERARIDQAATAEAQAQFSQHVAAEQAKLTDAIPEWKDDAVSKKDMAAIVDYATGNGFSRQELDQVTDHRAVIMLRKAMLYDQSQKAKETATKAAQTKIEKVKVAAPGSPNANKPKAPELSRRMQRLKNSGKESDAVSAIESMLGD